MEPEIVRGGGGVWLCVSFTSPDPELLSFQRFPPDSFDEERDDILFSFMKSQYCVSPNCLGMHIIQVLLQMFVSNLYA